MTRKRRNPKWKLDYAARFVAPWEGWRPEVYLDSGGIPTQGYGHTGDKLTPGRPWTKSYGLKVLAEDLREASRAVRRNVHVKLTFRERIAAISFAFNIGEGGLQSSTFLRRLNENRRKDASDALMLWVKDDAGNTLLGLKRRRAAERWMYLHPTKNTRG